jgi:hypothetical protein
VLGQADLIAPELVEGDVGDTVVIGEGKNSGHDDSFWTPGQTGI